MAAREWGGGDGVEWGGLVVMCVCVCVCVGGGGVNGDEDG